MLAAKFRFHGYGALKFLFGRGKTYRFKTLSLRVAHNPRRSNSRVAVVISKKVLKASPKRNRVRRRIYEALRQDWPHIKPSYDVLVSVYDAHIYDTDHAQLVAEIRNALKTADIWTD